MIADATATVVVVNFNAGRHLSALLGALDQQTVPHSTVVIDNASSDGSARAAHDAFPAHTYLPLRRNTGFAHAVNLGIGRAQTPLVVLLNPDTLPAPDFIEQITAPFAERPRLAAVAGTLVFQEAPEVIASAGIQIHRNGVALDRLLGERRGPAPLTPVFGASGGAAAFRRDAFLDAGGFPDVFFMYLEDVDLAFRLQLGGWDALWQPAAVATHAYSASAGEGSPFKRRLIARNRIWTLARCLPEPLWVQHGARLAVFDAATLAYGLVRDRPAAAGRLEALARLLPRLCERREIQRRYPDGSERIEAWLLPSISPAELRRLRRVTTRLAARG
jgi:GT2 family glycosyltransferase